MVNILLSNINVCKSSIIVDDSSFLYIGGVSGTINIALNCFALNLYVNENNESIINSHYLGDVGVGVNNKILVLKEFPPIYGLSDFKIIAIKSILSMIEKCSDFKNAVNAIRCILNIDYDVEFDIKPSDYERVYSAIQNNFKDPTFSIEMLSKNVFMSKRKLQYVLSKNGVSFKFLCNDLRLAYLLKNIDKFNDINELIFRSGFKNALSANKVFKDKFGMTVKKYKLNKLDVV